MIQNKHHFNQTYENKTIPFNFFIVPVGIMHKRDKYEFMTINYETFKNSICISIDGEAILKEKLELSKDEKDFLNTNPLLKKVKECQDKGWE